MTSYEVKDTNTLDSRRFSPGSVLSAVCVPSPRALAGRQECLTWKSDINCPQQSQVTIANTIIVWNPCFCFKFPEFCPINVFSRIISCTLKIRFVECTVQWSWFQKDLEWHSETGFVAIPQRRLFIRRRMFVRSLKVSRLTKPRSSAAVEGWAACIAWQVAHILTLVSLRWLWCFFGCRKGYVWCLETFNLVYLWTVDFSLLLLF